MGWSLSHFWYHLTHLDLQKPPCAIVTNNNNPKNRFLLVRDLISWKKITDVKE